MGDVKEDVLEQCAAKSASAHILDAGDIEDMPELLETYVKVRNPLDLASIVVSLMPQQSKARYPVSIAKDTADAIHKTARVLDKYCREKHLTHVQDEANHVCQIEMLVIPKTPVLSMPLHLLENISEENGREQLERNHAS